MKRRRRVLLADDHHIVLEGLRRVLETDFEIAGEVADGLALVDAEGRLKPDIIVTDISMPLLGGIEAARRIRARSRGVKIVFLTMHADVDYAAEALAAGASAFVLKSSSGSELLEAIHESMAGRIYLTPAIDGEAVHLQLLRARQPDELRSKLTERQQEVLRLLSEGKSIKEAAAILKVCAKTVEFHKYRIMKELGVRTNAEMTKRAVRLGISTL
jgi:DNA-binding NarL/FixJ family response regulator